MMNNEAGSQFLTIVLSESSEAGVSADNYAQIIKRSGLVRLDKWPINGIRLGRRHEFLGFNYHKWVKGF